MCTPPKPGNSECWKLATSMTEMVSFRWSESTNNEESCGAAQQASEYYNYFPYVCPRPAKVNGCVSFRKSTGGFRFLANVDVISRNSKQYAARDHLSQRLPCRDNMLHNTTKSAGIILAVSKTSVVFQLCEVGGLSGFKPSLAYPVCLWH